jgi:hypothetical protein
MRLIGFEDNFFARSAGAERSKKKLCCREKRELETMEEPIAETEKELQGKHDLRLDPLVMSDSVRLRELSFELEEAQERIRERYTRWGELEKRSKEVMK